MEYVSCSVWHVKINGVKITGKVTQLEELADKKTVEIINIEELNKFKKSHIFSIYKLILNKKFLLDKSLLDKDRVFNELINKAYIDVDTKYPIYIYKDPYDTFKVILDGNRRLDKAFLTGEKNIKAKIFNLEDLLYVIKKYNLNT